MRARMFAAVLVLSCQPIMIGNPAEADGGAAALDGAGGATIASSAGNQGVLPNFGGMAGGGPSATGGSPDSPNAAGSPTGATTPAGAPTGGAASTTAGAGGDAAGAGGEADGSAPRILNERVLFVIYDPNMNDPSDPAQRLSTTLGVEAPDVLAMRLTAQLETLTNGHVHHEVLPFRTSLVFPPLLDGFRYDAAGYQACLAESSQCNGFAADYDAIEIEQELCSAVQSNNVDQIWLLGAEHFGFVNGRQLSCQVLEDEQYVTKTIDVVSLDYSRGFTSILFSYQLHAMIALQQVFGVSPANATAEAPDNVFGLFTQARGRAPDITVSGCGDITFAPNTLEPNRFDQAFTMSSYCDSFLHYPRTAPLAAAVSISCTDWGCTEVGFRGYWFSHLPRAPWADAQGKLNDFWRYLLYAKERLPPAELSVTTPAPTLP
jgi:hypothetical protein